MPKGKNHSSKRTTLKQKYKIQKKVREHHRKVKKEQKVKLKKAGGKKVMAAKKDPGIPNLWPFKEQLLQEVEEFKVQKAKEKADELLRRKREREKARKASMSQSQQMEELKRNARAAQNEFDMHEDEQTQSSKSNDAQHTRRAFYRELHKIIENSDVILEVLDARDPLGCRPIEVEQHILNKDPNKRIVMVLNKIDLVPKEMVNKWLKYLRREYPTVAIKCSTQNQKNNLGRSKQSGASASKEELSSSECIGGEQLLQLLKNYSRNNKMKMAVTVGVIGYPNVGKSSLINSLVRTRAVEAGATAGITKVAQQVQLDKKVKLLDCPGIVFAKDENDVNVILRNCVKLDSVVDPIPPVQEIVRRCDKMKLMSIYKIARFGSDGEFVQLVAQARGKVKKGGVLDLEMAARSVLQDWNSGKVPYYTAPPQVAESSFEEKSVVLQWGKEFNLDEVQQVQVLDSACAAVDDMFMAMQGLAIGNSKADMSFAVAAPDADESMEEDTKSSGTPVGKREKLPEEVATKATKQKRAEMTAAAVRRQARASDDYDFDEAFAGEKGKYGALAGEDDDEEDEMDDDNDDDDDDDDDDEEDGEEMDED